MANSINNLMLPLLLLSALSFPPSVKPDDSLIGSLCSKTQNPAICSDCLRSDPSSRTADGRGLAIIAIRCAEKDTTLMATRLYELYQSTSEPILKNLLSECWLTVVFAAGDFSGMARIVGDGDYAFGKQILKDEIMPHVNSCLAMFNNNTSISVPSVVLAGTVAANQDCHIVAQILNHI